MRSFGLVLIPYEWCPVRRRNVDTDSGGRKLEKTATNKPMGEVSEETDPADTLILHFWPPVL